MYAVDVVFVIKEVVRVISDPEEVIVNISVSVKRDVVPMECVSRKTCVNVARASLVCNVNIHSPYAPIRLQADGAGKRCIRSPFQK